MFKDVVLPPHAPRPVITVLAGESLTDATFRQLDPFHGRGLAATDQTVIVGEDCAATRRALDEALKVNAELLADHDTQNATICQLRRALADAHALIADLQEQLESARADAGNGASPEEVAWVLHLESRR